MSVAPPPVLATFDLPNNDFIEEFKLRNCRVKYCHYQFIWGTKDLRFEPRVNEGLFSTVTYQNPQTVCYRSPILKFSWNLFRNFRYKHANI
jgi:hypothetical protein